MRVLKGFGIVATSFLPSNSKRRLKGFGIIAARLST